VQNYFVPLGNSCVSTTQKALAWAIRW